MFSVADLFVISLVFVSTQCGPSVHNPFYCHSEDPFRQWTLLGGTTSPYEAMRGQFNANASTCTPAKLWLLARHGERYPFIEELPELRRVSNEIHGQILVNYNRGKTSLCASDFELLKNWSFPDITDDLADHLLPLGWNNFYELAQRFQAAFPTILPSTYSPRDFFFQPSNHARHRQSLEAFADGLFGVNAHEQVVFQETPNPDVYMRPWGSCDPFLEMLEMDGLSERNAFEDGPEYQEMVVQVSAKLGLHHSNVLRNSDLHQLAYYCKYEQFLRSNFTEPPKFCAAFSVGNVQVIEYANDIEWQDRVGSGLPQHRQLKENLMCFTLQDMLRFIQSNDENDHKVRMFCGHATQFLFLLPFGAFDADPLLTRHNFAQQTERAFKTSYMLGMGSNLAIIRFDCADGDNDLLFLLNERPVQIPGCDLNGVCKQSLIMQRLEKYLNGNCWEIFCSNS
ncbi:hypothetical protein HA402_004742 [Bradysia odoriphaga]|nr:hypothetical protein HA402_004742 [Bradysia odoriphaga]